jgi:hypothetical protein
MTGRSVWRQDVGAGYKHDGLILPQFVPTNGWWLYAKLAFSNSPGAPGADDIP